MEPRWLMTARKYLGQKELPGKANNPLITRWWKAIRSQFVDDSVPWCAAFVGGVLEECGIKSSRSAAARSYESWGAPLDKPYVGAIVTFKRRGGGHVGFVVGQTASSVSVLGGNQRDMVNVTKFSKAGGSLQITGYRWPAGEPLPTKLAPKSHVDLPVGGPVTFVDMPDDEDAPKGLFRRILQWGNAIGSAFGFVFATIAENWKTAAVICAAGLVIFLVIWFTTRGKRCSPE